MWPREQIKAVKARGGKFSLTFNHLPREKKRGEEEGAFDGMFKMMRAMLGEAGDTPADKVELSDQQQPGAVSFDEMMRTIRRELVLPEEMPTSSALSSACDQLSLPSDGTLEQKAARCYEDISPVRAAAAAPASAAPTFDAKASAQTRTTPEEVRLNVNQADARTDLDEAAIAVSLEDTPCASCFAVEPYFTGGLAEATAGDVEVSAETLRASTPHVFPNLQISDK